MNRVEPVPGGDLTIIRAMEKAELGEVLAIEAECFSDPWTEQMFVRELSLSVARNLTARIGDRQIDGYLNCWIIAGEIHLHRIAVRKSRRRRGIAAALMNAMMGIAEQEQARCATLEVRSGNEPARLLYERFGFAVRGVRPCYYDDTKEDALILWAELEKKRAGEAG